MFDLYSFLDFQSHIVNEIVQKYLLDKDPSSDLVALHFAILFDHSFPILPEFIPSNLLVNHDLPSLQLICILVSIYFICLGTSSMHEGRSNWMGELGRTVY